MNGLLFILSWYGRKHATKVGSPRIFYSFAMCAIPYYALVSTAKLDS